MDEKSKSYEAGHAAGEWVGTIIAAGVGIVFLIALLVGLLCLIPSFRRAFVAEMKAGK